MKHTFVPKAIMAALSLTLSATSFANNTETNFWNQELTKLMRESQTHVFSNWSNNSAIEVGAIGYIDHITGEFTIVSTELVNHPSYFNDKEINEKWELTSKDTHHTTIDVNLSGNYTSLSTGSSVKGAIKNNWEFNREKSVAATYIMKQQSYTNNVYQLFSDNWETIKSAADTTPYTNQWSDGIYQGFGIITGVTWANRGVTIASSSKSGSYGMTTSLGFFSPKKDDVSIEAKIYQENTSKDVTAITFPSEDQPEYLVPVSFTFTSLDGRKPIVNWTKPIHQLELIIDSQAGATYLTQWNVSFTDTEGNYQQQTGQFPAPQSAAVYLPKGATNVQLTIELPGVFSSNECVMAWHDPINQWTHGKKEVQTFGVWPANGGCTEL